MNLTDTNRVAILNACIPQVRCWVLLAVGRISPVFALIRQTHFRSNLPQYIVPMGDQSDVFKQLASAVRS